MHWIWVACGGALGSLIRVALQAKGQAAFPGLFPMGTLAVNLAGAAAIGLLAALLESFGQSPAALQARSFLMAGVLGGFTTFSAFSLETMNLIRAGEWRTALAYVLASNVLGIALALGSHAAFRAMLKAS